jgi:hypothetical protein
MAARAAVFGLAAVGRDGCPLNLAFPAASVSVQQRVCLLKREQARVTDETTGVVKAAATVAGST